MDTQTKRNKPKTMKFNGIPVRVRINQRNNLMIHSADIHNVFQLVSTKRSAFIPRAEVVSLMRLGEKQTRIRFRQWINEEVLPAYRDQSKPHFAEMLDEVMKLVWKKKQEAPTLNFVMSETIIGEKINLVRYWLQPVKGLRRKPNFIVRKGEVYERGIF
ncbi:MAG: hypothetical protein HQM06_13355 [Magnetococcales bacterium]|nr:hypothetical protein [Magnetococcales bacterium]